MLLPKLCRYISRWLFPRYSTMKSKNHHAYVVWSNRSRDPIEFRLLWAIFQWKRREPSFSGFVTMHLPNRGQTDDTLGYDNSQAVALVGLPGIDHTMSNCVECPDEIGIMADNWSQSLVADSSPYIMSIYWIQLAILTHYLPSTRWYRNSNILFHQR